MQKARPEIITFKVDKTLSEAMSGIENRSEFIRQAVLAALDHVCPLCQGSGVLSPKQREHWLEFSGTHPIAECDDCHERHIVCVAESSKE